MAAPPANDNFVGAISIALPATATGNNKDATRETGETTRGESSVWYSWYAQTPGWVAVDTIDPDAGLLKPQLNTVVAVFTGSSVDMLALVGVNVEAWEGSSRASKLVFYADQGTTYKIAVNGYSSGDEGPFVLHLTGVVPEASVTEMSFSPAVVDVSTESQTANVTVTIASNTDLFSSGVLDFFLRSPNGGTLLLPVPILNSDLLSGNSTLGIYKKTVTIPRGIQPGSWVPSLQIIRGNEAALWSPGGNGDFPDYSIIYGPTQLLTVKNDTQPLDTTAPVLAGFSISTATAAPFEKVTANLTITDAGGAGFLWADVWLVNDTLWSADYGRWLVGVSPAALVGNLADGHYKVSFSVPADLAQGVYHFDVYLWDAAANSRGYGGLSAGNILSNSTLTIGNDTIIQGWRRQNWGTTDSAGDAGDLADPDKDGLVNLLEFGTNHDPKVPDSSATTFSLAGDVMTLSYTRSHAAASPASGVKFFVESSDTLSGAWSTVGVSETATDGLLEDQVRATLSLGAVPRRFMRLRVEQQ